MQNSIEDERHKAGEQEVAYQVRLQEAIALPASGDCVVLPLAPPSLE